MIVAVKTCSKCGVTRPLTKFYRDLRGIRGRYSYCSQCCRDRINQWRRENPEENKRLNKARYEKHKEKSKGTARKRWRELKVEVLTHYGGGRLVCTHCGCIDIRVLSIDHIEGGGLQHRNTIKVHSGSGFYSWLRKVGFPEGYQTLCMNCQFIKRAENKEI